MKQWLGRLRSPQGLQGRWLKNILSLVVAVVIIAGVAFTLAAAAYSYTAMRTGLETKAKTTMAFFRNYLDLSYDECYESCVLLTQDFEDKNIIELQFINARGELITSSYGLFHMDDPDTADVKSALEGQTMGYFVGSDPATRERIMAVSAPLVYSDGRVVGALRFVTSTKNADRFVLFSLLIGIIRKSASFPRPRLRPLNLSRSIHTLLSEMHSTFLCPFFLRYSPTCLPPSKSSMVTLLMRPCSFIKPS